MISREYASRISKIGGAGRVVEIDESCIGRRKNNKGRVRNQICVFGAVEHSTGRFNMKIIPNRKFETLGQGIEEMILPSTHINSDDWPAYSKYFSSSNSYSHSTVTHKFNFIDPSTDTHTQSIEARWGAFKK
ncbi:hypothetical protein H312_01469 [Anncaliia algerae PRA339]|uniref:ISXO2-like transposase domain-containing protein n=1 Tax=Anncaliia algerae PRA339 TaxID=1288291 RepID=A0A059F1G5_9MICR|nr:hypothetical protein H312_01469 [Anncaliia algerae PRA339]